MRFTIRGLCLYIALVGVVLGSSRWPIEIRGFLLITGIIVLGFLVPARMWRSVVYGGLLGVILLAACLLSYTVIRYPNPKPLKADPDRVGRRWVMVDVALPLYPLGALAGGTVGFVFSLSRTGKPTQANAAHIQS